jgi:hypothetical protein
MKILKIDRLLTAVTCAGVLLGSSLLHTFPSEARKPKSFPTHGKLVQMFRSEIGPLCAVDLIDDRGRKYSINADGKICDQKKLLNKTVNLTYKFTRVAYCDAPDVCFDKKLNIIVRMRLQEQK